MHEHHHSATSFLSLMPLAVVIGVSALYVLASYRQRRRGHSWSRHRILSFIAGTALLATALLPSLHQYALQDLRGHMYQHLLIGMLAPIGLVFGAPVTLVLRSLPKCVSRQIAFILHSKTTRMITHPVVALTLNIGGMAVLYLTPLYLFSLNNIHVHVFVHVHFLLAGYLFAWSIAGPDPAPKRPGLVMRLVVLFIAMASHAMLSKYMYAQALPHGTHHPMEQIQAAARIMYYGGDFSELVLAVALFLLWYTGRLRTGSPQGCT